MIPLITILLAIHAHSCPRLDEFVSLIFTHISLPHSLQFSPRNSNVRIFSISYFGKHKLYKALGVFLKSFDSVPKLSGDLATLPCDQCKHARQIMAVLTGKAP